MTPANVHVVVAPSDPDRVRWLVRAANGRTLCRSELDFADASAAVEALTALRHRVNDLTLSLSHPPTGLGWIWSLTDRSGVVQIVGARSYERRGTCLNAYRHFVRSIPDLLAVN